MRAKTVPVFMASIGVLFLALVVIIGLLLAAPDRRLARAQRGEAVRVLMSGSGTIGAVASSVAAPYSPGGSLDDLRHYLSKDPGRREFAGNGDRRRADVYLQGTDSVVQEYSIRFAGEEVPEWAPVFLGTTRALFHRIRDTILVLTGIPDELTFFVLPQEGSSSAIYRVRAAVGRFVDTWVPQDRTASSRTPGRTEVRSYLLNNRRFGRRMEGLDSSWRGLAASLYNLSTHPGWRIAISFDPLLDAELNELTLLVLTADIYRRSHDLLAEVSDTHRIPGESISPGILWTPEFSYYKNIPEISGQTDDIDPNIFFAKVNLGYTFRDIRTQTWLNRRKDWLSDYFLSFFSRTVSEDFSPANRRDSVRSEWRIARLKAEGIHPINKKMVLEAPFGRRKMFGIRELALVRINLIANS